MRITTLHALVDAVMRPYPVMVDMTTEAVYPKRVIMSHETSRAFTRQMHDERSLYGAIEVPQKIGDTSRVAGLPVAIDDSLPVYEVKLVLHDV